ncbi:MAG TPA: hypothetical protein VG845_00225 [Dehalococcoidia bacterium]|jgi:hypothetical protein|nr:hypothetical protein [Dehalococcoidia bacterium]
MAPTRKLPRPFEMHWGSGEIVEEATFSGEYHEPAIQLMVYTSGEAAGGYSLRFCSYNHRGMFQRSPLMLGEDEIAGLRKALLETPRLREILKQLINDND